MWFYRECDRLDLARKSVGVNHHRSSLVLTLCAASLFRLSVPTLLHKLKLDLKIAAGPLTLTITDISTLLIYFSLAEALL